MHPGIEQAQPLEPVGQGAAHVLGPGDVAVHDDRERTPGKVLRIAPSGELHVLRSLGIFALRE